MIASKQATNKQTNKIHRMSLWVASGFRNYRKIAGLRSSQVTLRTKEKENPANMDRGRQTVLVKTVCSFCYFFNIVVLLHSLLEVTVEVLRIVVFYNFRIVWQGQAKHI
jgi:hypothetical protein